MRPLTVEESNHRWLITKRLEAAVLIARSAETRLFAIEKTNSVLNGSSKRLGTADCWLMQQRFIAADHMLLSAQVQLRAIAEANSPQSHALDVTEEAGDHDQ